MDAALAALTRRYGCRAALRASYLDQPGGVVYTNLLALVVHSAGLRRGQP